MTIDHNFDTTADPLQAAHAIHALYELFLLPLLAMYTITPVVQQTMITSASSWGICSLMFEQAFCRAVDIDTPLLEAGTYARMFKCSLSFEPYHRHGQKAFHHQL